MISDTITKLINQAMKSKDTLRVSTLRLLASELHNAKIDKREVLSAEEELVVVQKEIKKRRDAIELYEKAGRQELANKEKGELKILTEFMPAEMGDNELEKIIDNAVSKTSAASLGDLGKVMNLVMTETKGRADGKRVSNLVHQKLSNLP
jgi:hypothetical protein